MISVDEDKFSQTEIIRISEGLISMESLKNPLMRISIN